MFSMPMVFMSMVFMSMVFDLNIFLQGELSSKCSSFSKIFLKQKLHKKGDIEKKRVKKKRFVSEKQTSRENY